MNKSSIYEQLLDLLLRVRDPGVSEEELRQIQQILSLLDTGNVKEYLNEHKEKEIKNIIGMRSYFSDYPKHYAVIVGASKIPSDQIRKIAKAQGFPENNLKLFLDYEKLKNDFPFAECRHLNCIGAIIGAVPHNVTGSNGHASAVSALEQSSAITITNELKITKEGLKKSFVDLAKKVLRKHSLRNQTGKIFVQMP